jgi:hypothetical protein
VQRFHVETFEAAVGPVYGRTVYEKYVPYWKAVAETGTHADGGAATDAEVRYATRVRELRSTLPRTRSTAWPETPPSSAEPISWSRSPPSRVGRAAICS